MRVLVTGGAGYIGSHVAKALSQEGHSVVVLDDLSNGHKAAVKWGPFVIGNCGDVPLVCDVLSRHRIEAVIHMAANAYVGESMHYPHKYFRNNVVNSLGLLDAMRHEDVRTIVFSSTCATYGDPVSLPIDESHPQKPVNPYGESKLFVERALSWYGRCANLRWLALRYFNAAGSDPEGQLREEHEPETHLIPLAIQAALQTRAALTMHGTDYPTPDGTPIRDYTHVSDLADAHVKGLHFLANGGDSRALNLGTGIGHSVREVISAVQTATGRPVPVEEAGRRPGDPPVLVANPSLASELLGWRPRFQNLHDIVMTALPVLKDVHGVPPGATPRTIAAVRGVSRSTSVAAP